MGASHPINASEYPQSGLIISLGIFQGEVVQVKAWNPTDSLILYLIYLPQIPLLGFEL